MDKANLKDHAELGRELDYFINDPLVGKGLPLLTPKGTLLKDLLVRFVEEEERRRGYLYTSTPVLARDELYKVSGHWEHFRENMFLVGEEDGGTLALRPMTCPFQFLLYKRRPHSYRELPVRFAETSTLFRNEASGALHGLLRIRQFTLSDGHIICRPDQVEEEFLGAVRLVQDVQKALGLTGYRFRLSLRGEGGKYIDNPRAWAESEALLKKIMDHLGADYTEARGEAAFYGPKLDVQMTNVWGKEDTAFTVQLDFALATRFGLAYADRDGTEKTPYIIHRSSIGCFERTMALLLERYQGRLPFWLSPEQLRLLPVTQDALAYASEVLALAREAGLRAELDDGEERLPRKIVRARAACVPVMVILGQTEAADRTVSLRGLEDGARETVPLEAFLRDCVARNQNRRT